MIGIVIKDSVNNAFFTFIKLLLQNTYEKDKFRNSGKNCIYIFSESKKIFNSKQLKAFIGFKINESDFLKLMNSVSRENYIINLGRGKYKFDSRRKYLTGKIINKKRALIDLETSTEFKITKREKLGLFDDDIVYYWIDRRHKIRIASLKTRELKKYVGIVKKKDQSIFSKIQVWM